MPRKLQITCDACGKDLLYTTNRVGYRLALKLEHQDILGPTVTCMLAWPPIEQDQYFCDIKCLRKFHCI